MKQSLQLKLGQQLTMTPQLQQAIRLLQLSTLDLQNEIQEALDSNPMLELEDDNSLEASREPVHDHNTISSGGDSASTNAADTQSESDSEYREDSGDDWNQSIPEELPVDTSWDDVYQTSSSSGTSSSEFDDMDMDSRRSVTESLYDHLMWQLNLTPMSDLDQFIALAIIDAVEPSGLLSVSIADLYEGLAIQVEQEELSDTPLELDEVVAVQHRIQQFDPVGVASQDLSECLLVQLHQFPADTPFLSAAKLIVRDHLPLLGNRDYKQLMRRTRQKEAELSETIKLIQSLNPRPGDFISSGETEYVVPDVFVAKQGDRWTVQLNPDIAPKLRINSDYAALVKRADSSSDNTFLRDNLQEARWFLKSLQSRNETLLKVASCIVDKQRGFLDYGAEAMKPLVLHDVAEIVGMHESTISRVTTQKYMHTPQGIFELKYFFSSHVSTDAGGECSSTAIRAIIKKLVAAENAKKPLSDSKITSLLAEQGIQVARRTIAKYRESLGIAASNERKRLV
jgi:RNA polymerase sigma-54 factor